MMKILFFLLLIPVCAKSQVYFGGSLGAYKGIIKEDNAPNRYTIGVHGGYTVSIFFAEVEERIDLLTKKVSNNFFGFKSGFNVKIDKVALEPFAGYYYNYVSADNTSLNHTYPAYGFKVNYRLDHCQVYLEGININTNQVSLGFNYNIDFSEY